MLEVITNVNHNKTNVKQENIESDSESELDYKPEIKNPIKFSENENSVDKSKQIIKLKSRYINEKYFDIKWLTGC